MKNKLTIALGAFLFSQAAFAHAFLDHASPAVGSQVSGSPRTLDLTYTEAVEPRFSQVAVTNTSGQRVDDSALEARGDGRVLSIKLKPLSPGAYSVVWHVTSVDTHKTGGHFSFTVKP